MVRWGITKINPNKNPLAGLMPRMEQTVEPKILKEKCLVWYTLTNRNKHKHILSPLLSELKIRTALDLSKTNMTSKTVYGSWPPLGCQHPQSCVCSDRSSPSCIPLPPGQTQGLLLILMEPRFRGGGRSTALKAWLRQNGGLYWS